MAAKLVAVLLLHPAFVLCRSVVNRTFACSFLCALAVLLCGSFGRADEVDFVRDIRPIISENCVFCHGPDEAQRHADLRLDTEDGAMSAITAGDHHASDLFDRISNDDANTVMPPPESNRQLTATQIKLIGQWIDQGAAWEKHWSFRPIIKPIVPDPASLEHAPIRNPIDAFVQKQLESSKLGPQSSADRRTLIRRLSLDLTGLPPEPERVADFLADETDNAYERLVDRLLDSPAYGQRMAWDWLDAARYADTNGYQGDRERTMWPWRDWVVRSFNENMPYDQFTLWQLAGDQLPDATLEQKMATGFCRNHMINGEGGRIAEENRVEYAMDMSETMGTVWLGLTLNCCRCHEHKYDPITNREYYQFLAFFNQTPVKGGGGDPQTAPNIMVPDATQAELLSRANQAVEQKDKELSQLAKQLLKQQPEWEQQRADELAAATQWKAVKPTKVYSPAPRLRLKIQSDASVLTVGTGPDNNTYTVITQQPKQTITGFRLEALRHPTMTDGGLAPSNSGNFVLTGFEAWLVDRDDDTVRTRVAIEKAVATFEQGGLKVKGILDDDPKTGWAVYNQKKIDRDHAAVMALAAPLNLTDDQQLEFILRHDSKHKKHNLGHFRISVTEHPKPKLTEQDDALVAAIQVAPKDRTEKQKKVIGQAHRLADPEYAKLKRDREAFVKNRTSVEKRIPKVMVMQDMEKQRETFVLSRGLYNKPTDKVTRAFPLFLPPPTATDSQPPNRLDLANWLIDDQNPLTARVTVNRFWQQFFGIGLVKTTEDFGRQGEIPVQMDLLNWLAADFRENGWDVKQLIRTIVTSHTYRQSSKVTREAYEIDPKNRLLARGARYRMPSWMLRDQALFVSGLLSKANSGPAVNTYQPEGVWEEASFGKKTYAQDVGEKLYRRSLYTYWRRIIAPTMFFDNASRQTCTVKSGRTNTPLHALQTLNNVAYVEAARVLAEAALKAEVADDKDRIQWTMLRVLGRNASPQEQAILLAGLQRTQQQYTGNADAAEKLIAFGESKHDTSLDPIQHACWTSLCLAVLNFDETLNRE